MPSSQGPQSGSAYITQRGIDSVMQGGMPGTDDRKYSFSAHGFGGGEPVESRPVVDVNPTATSGKGPGSMVPEIRKYKSKFNAEIQCAALWGKFSVVLQL